MPKATQSEVQVLIAVLDLLRRGVHQLSGEQLVQFAEIVQEYRNYVQKIVDESAPVVAEPTE